MSDVAIGLYGKVATQGDFLRAGAGELSQAGIDRWLDESVGVLATERMTLPEAATGFLFVPPGAPRAFVGALAPSEDGVGRRFPLLIFAELPAVAVASALPVVPTVFEPFVRAAGELALSGRASTGAELTARAAELAAPPQLRGDEVATLSNEPALPLLTALGGSASALAYALRTFVMACDQALKGGAVGRGATITVDAPAPSPATRELWLELARRRTRAGGAPPPSALLWNDGPTGRLLMSLGPPAPSMLSFLANPRHRSPRFWPLRTEVATAAAQALQALTAEQKRCVSDPRVSLAQLVAAFA